VRPLAGWLWMPKGGLMSVFRLRSLPGFAVALAVMAVMALGQVAEAASVTDTLAGAGAGLGSKAVVVADDDAREYLVDRYKDDNFTTGQDGIINVGDSLRGMFRLDKAQVTPEGGSTTTVYFGTPSSNNEWTGIFQIAVLAKIQTAGSSTTTTLDDRYTFLFGPDASWVGGETGSPLGVAGKAMVLMFEDSSSPYNFDPNGGTTDTVETLMSTAKDGAHFWSLGYTGTVSSGVAAAAAGEGWISTDSVDDLNATNVNSGITLGAFNLALNRVDGAGIGGGWYLDQVVSTLFAPLAGDTVEFIGSGSVNGRGTVTTPFDVVGNQVTLEFHTVPVPSAVLAGLGMLGALGVFRLRRRRS
jgi:hypothetical protein